MDPPHISDFIISALDDGNMEIRRAAISAIKDKNIPVSFDLVVSAIQDNYFVVRREALALLSKFENQDSLVLLSAALDDQEASVREAAFIEVAKIFKWEGLSNLKSSDPTKRCEVIKILSKKQDPVAIKMLAMMLYDSDSSVQNAAMKVLWRKRERVVDPRPFIIALQSDNWYVRSRAAWILEQFNISNE